MKNCLKIENEDPFFGELHSRNMDLGAKLDIFGHLDFWGPKKVKNRPKTAFFGKKCKNLNKKMNQILKKDLIFGQ